MVINSKADQENVVAPTSQGRDFSAAVLNIPNTWRKVSVIDLGYNSLKMVSYEVRPDGTFRAYDQRGELTKIGEGLDRSGSLSREAMNRTMRVLKILNEINRMEKVDGVLAVATSAVREARNGAQFVRDVESATKIKFRVLTAQEEALFSYVGGAQATRFPTVLFFDLGGGSLELTYAEDRKIKRFLSLPLGALRMTEVYGMRGGGYTKRDYERLKMRIAELLPSRGELDLSNETVLMGVGGTIRALARYDQWNSGYPLNKVHNYVIERKSIMATHKLLRDMTVDKISHIDSFSKDRAESVTSGSLIIAMLMDRLEFSNLVVSTHGLRDGVLSEYLRDAHFHAGERYTIEKANASLATLKPGDSKKGVVRSLAQLGILNKREEYILEEAIGSFMDLYLTTRPETLFYSIISLDSVLDHQEQLAAAIVMVRAKSPKMAKWYLEFYSAILRDIRRESIYKMGATVVLAEILYRTGSRATFSTKSGVLTIGIEAGTERSLSRLLLDEAASQLGKEMGVKVKVTFNRTKDREETV
jgi:exopolyphosphatase/guanosine-5'-triphosphate,3'-diphosphate pyrophosphatase